MKHLHRFSAFIVAFVFLTSVLSVRVFASTVYTFYRFEPPAVLSASIDFFPDETGSYFLYDGLVPEGESIISFDVEIMEVSYHFTSDVFQLVFSLNEDGFLFYEADVPFLMESIETQYCEMTSLGVAIGTLDGSTIIGIFEHDLSFASLGISHVYLTLVENPDGQMGNILAACDMVSAAVNDTFEIILSNPVLTVTTGSGLTGVGVLVYKRLRRGV